MADHDRCPSPQGMHRNARGGTVAKLALGVLLSACTGEIRGAAPEDLYITICHALGFTEVNDFGHPGIAKGPLAGLLV
jgi:hypothetical protein